MIRMYNIATDDENLKRFNENTFGVRIDTTDEFQNALDGFEDKLNRMCAAHIDNILKASDIPSALEDILPSDRVFYRKITSKILPDETDEEAASSSLLDIFLMVKDEKYHDPSPEQLKLMTKVLDYFSMKGA